jgi:hypothetical protein
MGDPEMSIWLRRPKTMKLSRVRRLIDKRKPSTINVKHSSPQGDQHLEGAAVFIKKDDFSHLEFTDSEGNTTININDMNLGRLEIVVTYEGFLPYVDFVRINGPEWITGVVTDVLHQYDTPHQSLVRLKLDKPIDGSSSRAWYARDSQADYGIILDAVTDAYVSGKRISLYVDDLDEGGTIERFQFR